VPKFDPLIVTAAPTAPEVTDRLVMLGAGTTVKLTPLLAWLDTVTTTFPVVAPPGTVTVMLDEVHAVTDAVVPLNLTVLVPCGDPNVVPVIVTDAPTAPELIDRLVICGMTVKLIPLLATPDTVTTTLPVVAALGTGTMMLVEPQLVGVPVVPLNFTVLVPCGDPKFLPVMVTEVPTGPEVTDRLVILGPVAWVLIAKKEKKKTTRTSIDFQLRARMETCLRGSTVGAIKRDPYLTNDESSPAITDWGKRA